jgi:tRNA-dihydrouridine synthase
LGRLERVLETLRAAVKGVFSVKVRLGFDSFDPFEEVLAMVERHGVDLITIHARTVAQSYRGEPHYDFIRRAVQRLNIPVFANGNVTSATKAQTVMEQTLASGVMVGRSAIRNPWIFRQIREHSLGLPVFEPRLRDVHAYMMDLWAMCLRKVPVERAAIQHLKKFSNFVGQSVDAEGRFVKAMRRCQDEASFAEVCRVHLLEDGRSEQLFADEPYPGVVARPNCEAGETEPAACSF